ncbi:HAD family hydrolase [Polynucleobacter sp. MWH-UH24A]|uniref:HAD family hydrolase n=1 Tax=Polynucleobacter sp. MWH-UH24A TaxID=2689110 RepID=UPI00203D6F55|nr:HAD family hydrolase [Polynucleobacter sp. MWH-UH24A]QWD76370.1 HAD family hydrolase [Polynucleobacter sp. MWH-UH24A]
MKINFPSAFTVAPDAVLLDLDDTLYAYDHAHQSAYKAIKQKLFKDYSVKESAIDFTFKQAKNEIKLSLKKTAASHSRLLYFQRMLELMGLGSQPLLCLDLEQTYWRTFLNNAQLFPGVKEFLDDLRILRIPSAIVTDLTAQIQFRKLLYFGLDRYFTAIVTSEEVGLDKPHPMIFELALKKINPSGDCIWMIGDNSINDILGAKNAIGAITLQKIHSGVEIGSNESLPDAHFNSFIELSRLLKALNEYASN